MMKVSRCLISSWLRIWLFGGVYGKLVIDKLGRLVMAHCRPTLLFTLILPVLQNCPTGNEELRSRICIEGLPTYHSLPSCITRGRFPFRCWWVRLAALKQSIHVQHLDWQETNLIHEIFKVLGNIFNQAFRSLHVISDSLYTFRSISQTPQAGNTNAILFSEPR